MKKILKFFTSTVFIFLACGVLLIIIGQGDLLMQWFPKWFTPKSSIHSILRSIGFALLGSGVFTAIIKSSEYSTVFSNVIGETIWSKKFIEKRSDKKQMWSMISKILYEEKFPQISDEIEEIITEVYFPTSHDYYLENYEIFINITNVNDDFYSQEETVNVTVKPNSTKKVIPYNISTAIDMPPANVEDKTDCIIQEFSVNGTLQHPVNETKNKDKNYFHHQLHIDLQYSDSYDLVVKRCKILCKKTNPDKRFSAKNVIKNMNVSIIADSSINLSFYKMGTVKDFIEADVQKNNGVKVSSWSYKGLILPHQGYIIILK